MYRDDGSHAGYRWFGTHEEAQADAKKFSRLFQDRRARVGQMFDTGHGKETMIRFLNSIAEYPDNG